MRVSSDGGTPERISELREGESWHSWPDVLPDSSAVLLTVVVNTSVRADEGQIHVIDLATGERRKLFDGGTYPRYASSGHIIFAREHKLFAAPFDLDRLEVTPPPISVLNNVRMGQVFGDAAFALSRDGVLAYTPGGPTHRTLVSVNRQGVSTPLASGTGPVLEPSPIAERALHCLHPRSSHPPCVAL